MRRREDITLFLSSLPVPKTNRYIRRRNGQVFKHHRVILWESRALWEIQRQYDGDSLKQPLKGVKKGEGRKLITGAFLARGQNGSMRVFKRHTKEGRKLKAFYSLSIPQMFNKDVMKKGFDEAQKTFEKEFEHNLDYYMGKIK
jgi:hypothetical protein